MTEVNNLTSFIVDKFYYKCGEMLCSVQFMYFLDKKLNLARARFAMNNLFQCQLNLNRKIFILIYITLHIWHFHERSLVSHNLLFYLNNALYTAFDFSFLYNEQI